MTGTFSGRTLGVGAAIKLIAWLLRQATGHAGWVEAVDTVGDVGLVVGAAVLAYALFADLRRVVLWRVRRKLTLSYIFIGVIPALLILAFFVIAGVLLVNSISASIVRNRVIALQHEADALAQLAAAEVRNENRDEAMATLRRLQAAASPAYAGVSYGLATATHACAVAPPPIDGPPPARPLAGGSAAENTTVPDWIGCRGFSGLVQYVDGPLAARNRGHLAARAVVWVDARQPRAVIVTVPLAGRVAAQLLDDTGVELRDISIVFSSTNVAPEPIGGGAPAAARSAFHPSGGIVSALVDRPLDWVAFFDATDWETGFTKPVAAAIRTSLRSMWRHVAPVERLGNVSFAQVLLTLMAVVGGLFLVIQILALIMGLALARSITGSVHELFAGTERVRRGDFTHKIAIRSRDQLGELAASFNSMTSSIEDLLQQKAEKERLEQELRIARNIQMSLLPQAPPRLPGMSLTAHCEPAREVGGDYYDYLPLGGSRLALLIADVAGKGTSAALYMAELKGIMLSLADRHTSPRDLLIDADRILARHLDTRTFITITYAIVDVDAGTLTYARAGHCPLIYLPAPGGAARRADVQLPDGMVLGLNLDDGEMFRSQLQQVTIPLAAGDLFLLYTDGITEAMNHDGEFFGDARLRALVEDYGHLPSDQLRDRIVRDVRNFAGTAVQQDDMTMLIVKMEGDVEVEGGRARKGEEGEVGEVGRARKGGHV
jgi:sigma-B regulation protein RsbU (phosphoserine phosphatase)